MKSLHEYLNSPFTTVPIPLREPCWHLDAKVPAEPGWYFIATNTPHEVLAKQTLWQHHYIKKKNGAMALVKNYDIAARCLNYSLSLSGFYNIDRVYSGIASNLQARAREHTFADPGTAALALARYPELLDYDWNFNYLTLRGYINDCPSPNIVLRLGEQIWRSHNGWPILCAE